MSEEFVENWKTHLKRMQSDVQDLSYLISKMWWENDFNAHTKREIEEKLEKINNIFKEVK